MAFDGDHYEEDDFWARIRRVTVSLVEYVKKVLLQAAPQSVLLEPANVDILVEPSNILIDLEEE